MSLSSQGPTEDSDRARLDEPADPLPPWARAVASLLGLAGLGAGSYGVFVSENQAGTALLLVVGAVMALVGIQGTPIRRFGSGEHSFELRDIARSVARESAEASRDGLTERAAALAEVARSIDPAIRVQSDHELYEDAVRRAIERVGVELDPRYWSRVGDMGIDAKALLPNGKANVQVKYRKRGPLGLSDVSKIMGLAQLTKDREPGGWLMVTNAPLSAQVQEHNARSASDSDHPFEVITWNDERDDDLLRRALARVARQGR